MSYSAVHLLFCILIFAYLSLPLSQAAMQQCHFLDYAVVHISAKAEDTTICGSQSALGSFRMRDVI